MMKTTKSLEILAAVLFASAALTACQVERGESLIGDQATSDAAGFDASDGSSGLDARLAGDAGLGRGPGAGTMSGTWLLYHERSTCLLGQEQLTHATYIVEIVQEGATLRETRRLCDARLSEILGMQVRIPDEVLAGIEFVEVDRGMVSTLRVGGSYVSSTEVALWGLELENPATDRIPESPDAPQVIDSDGDGHPAVSFVVGDDCLRYQAQRQVLTYHGTFTAPNQIDGRSAGVTDLVVYGGSDGFCTIAPPVESNDAASRFRMVRIDGKGGAVVGDRDGNGEVSCAEAMRLAPRVLQEREADAERCN
jgi:hypothetical protein